MALEVKLPHSFGPSTWVNTEKLVKRSSGFFRVSEICKDKWNLQMSVSSQLPETNMSSPVSDVSCSYNNYSASAMKSGYFPISLDDSLILKNKCEEIGPYLYGRCIYLVGMMGSGKTVVGRILADVLGYSFLDWRLTAIAEKGAQAYANANARVSLDFIAAKHWLQRCVKFIPSCYCR